MLGANRQSPDLRAIQKRYKAVAGKRPVYNLLPEDNARNMVAFSLVGLATMGSMMYVFMFLTGRGKKS